jgi:hypothetical protein
MNGVVEISYISVNKNLWCKRTLTEVKLGTILTHRVFKRYRSVFSNTFSCCAYNQAAKNNKPLLVPVTFMNGYRTLCEVDSASTVQEVVQNISEKIGLLDATGYSIYVTLHTKVSHHS